MQGPVPMIGQQAAVQRAQAHQVVMGCYLGLIPVVAAKELERADTFGDQEAVAEAVAEKAWRITAVAVKRLGIEVSL